MSSFLSPSLLVSLDRVVSVEKEERWAKKEQARQVGATRGALPRDLELIRIPGSLYPGGQDQGRGQGEANRPIEMVLEGARAGREARSVISVQATRPERSTAAEGTVGRGRGDDSEN